MDAAERLRPTSLGNAGRESQIANEEVGKAECLLASSHFPFIATGHFFALTSLVLMVSASSFAEKTPLPTHALLVLLCVLPLRAIISFAELKSGVNQVQSAEFMALTAAVLFSSNAMHAVASRAKPSAIIAITGYAALDIAASWMVMAAGAKSPYKRKLPLFSLFVSAACDVLLASTIAQYIRLARWLSYALMSKAVLNVSELTLSSLTVVRRDVMKRNQHKD